VRAEERCRIALEAAPNTMIMVNGEGTETILLAEDEEVARKLAIQVLEMYGYEVLEAAKGVSALLICECHRRGRSSCLSPVSLCLR